MKRELTEKDFIKIAEIAEQAGSEFVHDGGEDDRIFLERRIDYNVSLMSKEQYKKLCEDLSDFDVKGKGFEVFAWNDSGPYEYWRERGEAGDYNYIQVTAMIKKPDSVNVEELKEKMLSAFDHFDKWDNIADPSEENTSIDAVVKQMKIISQPEDLFQAKNLTAFDLDDIEKCGYRKIETLFCDSSGFGSPSEPALTKEQARIKIKELMSEHGKMYAAITGAGQFQVYVTLFKKTRK